MKKRIMHLSNFLMINRIINIMISTSFIFFVTILFGRTVAICQEIVKIAPTEKVAKAPAISIDGNWELIWAKYNGVVRNPGKPFQFKVFNNGYFSMVAWDSTGKFAYCGYGKYELNGNVYKETHIWGHIPKYVGAYDLQEYELKGDTLYFKGFTKVVLANGEDITNGFDKIEEKRIRAK